MKSSSPSPNSPAVAAAEDLSNRDVFVRKSSSYYQSLLALNKRLEAAGKPPVRLESTGEPRRRRPAGDGERRLDQGDRRRRLPRQLLAGVSEAARQSDRALRTGGDLAIAIRKNSPQVKNALEGFQKKFGVGTVFGNTIRKRYLQNTSFANNATAREERQKFESLIALFRKYGAQYHVDYLLMAAQGYQESRLDQRPRATSGAIGVMQIMPATGEDLDVGNIAQLEPNIHGGIKYMRPDGEYFAGRADRRTNKLLFAFASYNAGPGRIRQLRKPGGEARAQSQRLVRQRRTIVSERIGRETVTYVSNIFNTTSPTS